MKNTVVFLHHRDLRVVDNRALRRACTWAHEKGFTVSPVFIFTPEQIVGKIASQKSLACMRQSLAELAHAYKEMDTDISFFKGDTIDVLEKIHGLVAVFETADYTPYAKKRTAAISKIADIYYETVDDMYINAPGSVLNKGGKPYQKFTPYYETSLDQGVEKPEGPCRGPYAKSKLTNTYSVKLDSALELDDDVEVRAYVGGRREGLELLKKLPRNYIDIHDVLAEHTSGLSVHLNYGTLSVREVYKKASDIGGADMDAFIRQLYWRDFYGQIIAFFEELYGVGAYEFQASASEMALSAEKKKVFKDWCAGRTGVPLVDACMNQMNKTGYMHNRGRLVVSNWLVKDMGIHFRHGERYFAKKLLDYNFSQNFGNWCWVASVLPFSQAPFRRIDAYATAKKFDADGAYVEKWLRT